jgi:hypothetical protein
VSLYHLWGVVGNATWHGYYTVAALCEADSNIASSPTSWFHYHSRLIRRIANEFAADQRRVLASEILEYMFSEMLSFCAQRGGCSPINILVPSLQASQSSKPARPPHYGAEGKDVAARNPGGIAI